MPINYKDYPENWKDEIRPAILKREGNKCKFCGVPNRVEIIRENGVDWLIVDEFEKDWAKRHGIKVIKVVLTIAHLDQDRNNNNYNNLAALCQRCHLRHDHPHKLKYRKLPKQSQRRINTTCNQGIIQFEDLVVNGFGVSNFSKET